MTVRTVSARITGRVQGVGYRAWAQQQARALGLSGWVRNEPDGSVRALLHGPGDAVDAMLAACRDGPSAALVDEVDAAQSDPPDGDGFAILR